LSILCFFSIFAAEKMFELGENISERYFITE
jgi:hypothetical protein